MESENLKLSDFSLEELVELRDSIKVNKKNFILLSRINHEIAEFQGRELNRKFDFNRFNVVPCMEKEILDINKISNVQELLDANLDSLKDKDGYAIGESSKEYFKWARHMYDMRSLANYNKKENK